MQNWYRIAKQLARQRTGQITEEELQELEKWRKLDPKNELLYTHWQKGSFLENGYQNYKNINSQQAFLEMQERIQQYKQKALKKQILHWSSIAAILVIVILAIHHSFNTPCKKHLENETTIAFVETQAPILTLANGECIILDSIHSYFEEAGTLVKKENNSTLKYTSEDTVHQNQLAFNTLDIPKGAEFHLTLSDGTQVWLNADSKLTYPVFFNKEHRVVELQGEAYFKVAPDKTKKFKVITQKQTIEVLGTEFNIIAYPEEKNSYTTLVNGKVKVNTEKQQITLHPGTQSIVDHNNIYVRKVNAAEIISWREGMFVLENHTLEEIMAKLARWYDFSVLYQNSSLKKVTFKGKIPRYSSFEEILNILEKTEEVKFKVKNKKVIVYR